MLTRIKIGLKLEWKTHYTNWSPLFFLINEITVLTFMYFMAKAFIPKTDLFESYQGDYFIFILIGETCFRSPLVLMNSFVRNLKNLGQDGMFDDLLMAPKSLQNILTHKGIAALMIEFAKVIIILSLAVIIFKVPFHFLGLVQFALLQVSALPLFAGLGLLALAIFIKFKRGDHLVNKLASLMVVLSGAYFPVQVFPESFRQLLIVLLPLNHLVDSSRKAMALQLTFSQLIIDSLSLVACGLFVSALGYMAVKYSIVAEKKFGRPFLFRY